MYFTIFKEEKKETTLVKPASGEQEIGKIDPSGDILILSFLLFLLVVVIL